MFDTKSLVEYWNPLVERCGLILADGKILEVPNTHPKPEDHFSIARSYFTEYPDALATWHTHPSGQANLTVEDYRAFLTQPNLFHYIVGDGIVWGFYVKENRVYLYEDDGVSRVSQGDVS